MTAPIYITGRGLITACGDNCQDFFSALQNGQSGLKKLTLFDSPRCGHVPVGQISTDLNALCPYKAATRSEQLALIAAVQALSEAGLGTNDRQGVAVVTGACTGGMRTSEELIGTAVAGQIPDFQRFSAHECARTSMCLARELGLTGPQVTLSTACTSGALAIAVGADLIKSGQAEVVLCGGVDSLTKLTLNGFSSLLVVSPDGPRPFDHDRHGMSLGEGAAYVILESAAHLAARSGKALAKLSGYGVTCDAHHASAPHPEGAGAIAAIKEALAMSGLEPRQIDYINAHGTGTLDNDKAEALAIANVFNNPPPVSSTKAFYGHPLAASGAIEAILATLAIDRQWIPPNKGLQNVDPAVSFTPLKEGQAAAVTHVMSNSFGFGGNNTVLIISQTDGDLPAISANSAAIQQPGLSLGLKEAAALWPAAEATPYSFPEWISGQALARQIEGTPWKALLPAAKLRRLGRVQCAALSAAQMALNHTPVGDPASAVIVATGLGEHSETAAFVENMFRNNEETPMPAKFINSVHNSLAGQLAIWHHLTGANHTFTHNRLSLTAALWQAAVILQEGRAAESLIVSADTISPYGLVAGAQLGWLDDAHPAGEGAAAFIATKVTAGLPKLDIYWHYDPKLLQDADLLLTADLSSQPADLPSSLALATWEQQSGRFMTADGLALAAAYNCLKQGSIDSHLQMTKGTPQKLQKIAIYQKVNSQEVLWLLAA